MSLNPESRAMMPSLYNRSVELCRQRVLGSWINRDPGGRALDIDCGDGGWCIELAIRGWNVTGFGSNKRAIERARGRADENCVRCNFHVADIAHEAIHGQYELILSVGVLQHIPDHDLAADTLSRLSAALAPGGHLVLLEAAPTRRESRCDTKGFRARTFDWYRRALADAGLDVVQVLGVDPMPLKTWLLPHYRQLPRLVGDFALGATSALTLPLDLLLGPSLPRTSWHKLIVAARTTHS